MTTFTKGTKGTTKAGWGYEVVAEATPDKPMVAKLTGRPNAAHPEDDTWGYKPNGELNIPRFLVEPLEAVSGTKVGDFALQPAA